MDVYFFVTLMVNSRVRRFLFGLGSGLLLFFLTIVGGVFVQQIPISCNEIFCINEITDLFEIPETHAQNTDTRNAGSDSDGKKATDREIWTANSLQNIVRVIYLLMWPLLAIAGAALDNSLVYGEAFFLNISLWKMWQIMRNFANFALGGVFLASLLYMVSTGGADNNSPWGLKNILPKMLLAGILIQASRFGMKALIDLSTVAIYAVGGLPLNILESELKEQEGDSNSLKYLHFLEPQVQFSFDNNAAEVGTDGSLSVFYTCRNATREEHAKKYFLPCRIEGNTFIPYGQVGDNNTWQDRKHSEAAKWAKFGRRDDDTDDNKKITTDEIVKQISNEYCVRGNKLMYMIDESLPPYLPPDPNDPSGSKDAENRLKDDISIYAIYGKDMDDCRIDNLLTKAHLQDKYPNFNEEGRSFAERGGAMAAFECPTLYSIIDGAAGMTGPLYALYASVLNMSEIALTPNHKGVIEISLEFLIKTLTALALVIPLLTLAIVLVMRAVILRGFIIFSPLLVIGWLFFKDKVSSQSENATVQELVALVFMPVVAVFAISMSLVILSLFQKPQLDPQNDSATQLGHVQVDDGDKCIATREGEGENRKLVGKEREDGCPEGGCGQTNKECYAILEMFVLCFTESQRQFGNGILNIMTWLVINIFGIGLMWAAVFAALRTSSITRSVVKGIQDLSHQVLKALPVVPTPMGLTSVGALGSAASQAANIPQSVMRDQANEVDSRVNKIKSENSTDAKKVSTRLDAIAKDTQENATKALKGKDAEAVQGSSIMNDASFNRALSASAGGKQIKNINEAFSSREGYDAVKSYGSGNFQKSRDRMIKTTGTYKAQDHLAYGTAMHEGLTKLSIDPAKNKIKAYKQNDSNGTSYFFDSKDGHNDLITLKRDGAGGTRDISHTPLRLDDKNLKQSVDDLKTIFAELGNDEAVRSAMIKDLGLAKNSLFSSVYEEMTKKRSQADIDKLNGNTTVEKKIDGTAYKITFTDTSFRTVSSIALNEK